jgi:dihydropteroate synthase
VDTYKPEVMRAALEAGATIINDIYGLRMPGALEVIAHYQPWVCLMHHGHDPLTQTHSQTVDNIIEELKLFFRDRVIAVESFGIPGEKLIFDPGFGFGKTLEHNWQLLKGLAQLKSLGYPMLVGLSRKSMVGDILEVPPKARLVGSLTAAILAAVGGANLFRVHDVKETVQAMTLLKYFRDCPPCSQEEALNVVN